MSLVDVNAVKAAAEKELQAEFADRYKDKFKDKLRQIEKARKALRLLERELEDMQADIDLE